MLYFDVNCATEVMMQLWWQWWSLVAPLRAACTRQRSEPPDLHIGGNVYTMAIRNQT